MPNDKSLKTLANDEPLRSPHRIRSNEDRALRRIGIVIWVLAAGCLVFAAVVWFTLLRALP